MRTFQIVSVVAVMALSAAEVRPQSGAPRRPTIGVALGGGGALGFAHVGVLRWFEDHHVPIDRIAGTSMGGLVGGAYAAGMTPSELADLLRRTDWDDLFGSSAYRYKSIARKEDARAYPSRLEFHLRGGFSLPTSLNSGQQIDLLLSRIGALYAGLPSFDALPTPFRSVALDLRSGTAIVLDCGSLPRAMRATMSLPGIFPPVEMGPWVLVDGGAMNNVPADVARAMGADVVIAVPVAIISDTNKVAFSVFGLLNNTVYAMQRANTRRGMAAANIVIHPMLADFNGLDWRRAEGLAAAGYRAAEAMTAQLLPLAVNDAEWREYLAARDAKRRTHMPVVASLEVTGAIPDDERFIRRRLRRMVGKPLDITALEANMRAFGGLDRYRSVSWDLAGHDGAFVLLVTATPLRSAPPIVMAAINVQNRTSEDFTFQLAARYLGIDAVVPGSQLRVDVALGTDRSLGAELRKSIGRSPLFVAATAIAKADRVNFTRDDAIAAQYGESRIFGQLDLGVTAGADAELRAGIRSGYYDSRVRIGNPGLPALRGTETQVVARGIYDTQNSAVVPSNGMRIVGNARYVIAAPEPDISFPIDRTNNRLTQAELGAANFWSWRQRAERVFVLGEVGTSFGHKPLPTDQFVLGVPLRLDAFALGERRGDAYASLTAGYLHVFGRLPDFLGGPAMVGAWLENGSAFDEFSNARLETQLGVGAIAETLVGPVMIGYSAGSRARRVHVSFGRLFR